MQNDYETEQLSIYDLDLWCGRMFPEPSPAELPKERTSGSSSRRSSELKSVVFQSLDLTPGAGNLLGESYWELISPWRGDALTLNTGVSPREEKESSLSQILQDDPPDKYYLTPKACLGILRRALERGKELPKKLKRALEIQSGVAPPDGDATKLEAYHINQRDEGINLHGVSGALMATNNMQMQTFVTQPEQEPVFCITGNAIDRQPKNGGNGIGYQQDIAYTLTATDHHAVFSRQRVDVFKDGEVVSTQSARQHKDATDLVLQGTGRPKLIRRLTPLECERLQGFPDNWTAIPGASDSARYKALGNSVAIPCVDYVLHGISLVLLAS